MTYRPVKLAARGLLVGALVSASMTVAASSAGVATAACTPSGGNDAAVQCALDEISSWVQLGRKPSASAQGRLGGSGATAGESDVTGWDPPTAESRPAPRSLGTRYTGNDPVLVAESMVGTDLFGPYGCEDFVDAAFGLTTETGIGHDMARSFYEGLAAQGLDHHEKHIPRGALVFSYSPYGNHVDISRGDGTFVSGGVQGLSPGYGDGHQIQILPSANLGAWSMYGWAYAPW